eukprot:756904-Hanusia_phi.AAC.2
MSVMPVSHPILPLPNSPSHPFPPFSLLFRGRTIFEDGQSSRHYGVQPERHFDHEHVDLQHSQLLLAHVRSCLKLDPPQPLLEQVRQAQPSAV